jgi:alkanesulfonate monooxygenase SsuD/methylene tetrahydromethanopterin reductase-like flavin-dependent oxidoreductase (luciferase family)
MVMLALRFDLRNPAFAGVSTEDRLRAALDMAAWADERGGVSISISEHHCSPDGYLPSPVVFAAALAARTRNVRISIGALVAPLYDPIRLAEDLAVLDNLSGGRIDLVLGNGYVAEEFEMFGVPLAERGRRTTELVETLRRAWTAEPFEFRGRAAHVTPAPHQPGGPRLVLGGSSDGAARRAARIGDGYVPVSGDSWAAYQKEMLRLGKADPGPHRGGMFVTTFLASDPEATMTQLLPYFVHETNAYGRWLDDAGMEGPYKQRTAEQVRTEGQYRVITPEEHAAELRAMGEMAVAFFHPMAGGVPPELAWESLRLYETEVLPALPA